MNMKYLKKKYINWFFSMMFCVSSHVRIVTELNLIPRMSRECLDTDWTKHAVFFCHKMWARKEFPCVKPIRSRIRELV